MSSCRTTVNFRLGAEEAAFIRARLKTQAADASAAIEAFVRRGREGRPLPEKLRRRRLAALRDLALFNTAVDTMLRCSDLLALRIEDVLSRSGEIFDEIPIQQQKTRRSVVVVLLPETQASLRAWIEVTEKRPEDPLFSSVANRNFGDALARVQYGNIVKGWAALVGRDPRRFSTHSMRRTKASVIYRQTRNLRACQLLLGHASIAHTAAYLAVDQREAIEIAKAIEV